VILISLSVFQTSCFSRNFHPFLICCSSTGNNSQALADLIKGSGNSEFSKLWKTAQRPVVVVGADVARRVDADFIFGSLQQLAAAHPKLVTDDWNGLSVLHRAASRVAALDIGFVPGTNASTQAPSVVYLLGADDIRPKEIPQGTFVIYQVSHSFFFFCRWLAPLFIDLIYFLSFSSFVLRAITETQVPILPT